jgi:hypothetical protein
MRQDRRQAAEPPAPTGNPRQDRENSRSNRIPREPGYLARDLTSQRTAIGTIGGHPGRFWYAAPPSSLSGLRAGDGRREICGGAFDEGAGDVGEVLVGVPGVVADHGEGAVHVDAEPLGELALCLLDDDPAVQRGLELLGDGLAAAHIPLLQ